MKGSQKSRKECRSDNGEYEVRRYGKGNSKEDLWKERERHVALSGSIIVVGKESDCHVYS